MKHLKLYEEFNNKSCGHPGFLKDHDDIKKWAMENLTLPDGFEPFIIINNAGNVTLRADAYWHMTYYNDYLYNVGDVVEEPTGDVESPEYWLNIDIYTDMKDYCDWVYDDTSLMHELDSIAVEKHVKYIEIDLWKSVGTSFELWFNNNLCSWKGMPQAIEAFEMCISSYGHLLKTEEVYGSFGDDTVYLDEDDAKNCILLYEEDNDHFEYDGEIPDFISNYEDMESEFLRRIQLPVHVDYIPDILCNLEELYPDFYNSLSSKHNLESWMGKIEKASKFKGVIKL